MGLSKLLSIAGALIIGMALGFGGARLRHVGGGRIADDGLSQTPRDSVVMPSSHEQAASAGIEDQIHAISQEPVRSRRLVALDSLCKNLDLEEVRRAAMSIPDGSSPKNQEMRRRFLIRWAELDPPVRQSLRCRFLGRSASTCFRYGFRRMPRRRNSSWRAST